MAYNYSTGKAFKLEYFKLESSIKKRKLFNNTKYEEFYISKWIELLKRYDLSDFIHKDFNESNRNFKQENGYEPEYYYTEIRIEDFTFPIAFNIERIHEYFIKFPDLEKKATQLINVQELFHENSLVQTNIINGIDTLYREDKEKAIYLSEFLLGYTRFSVIDGNIRLNYAKNIGLDEIECVMLTQEFMIECKFFLYPLDQLLYILNNEVIALQQMKALKLSDLEKLSNSFILNGVASDLDDFKQGKFNEIKSYLKYYLNQRKQNKLRNGAN